MSALGQKQTCAAQNAMSALPPLATAKATTSGAPHLHWIIPRSIMGNPSNNIIQKGLAFRFDRSATGLASWRALTLRDLAPPAQKLSRGFGGAAGGLQITEGDPDDKDSKEANCTFRCTIEQPTEAQQGRSEWQPRCSGQSRYQAISCNRNAALPRWRDHRCLHQSHRLAVAFGAGLSCRGRAQASQARFEIESCRGY